MSHRRIPRFLLTVAALLLFGVATVSAAPKSGEWVVTMLPGEDGWAGCFANDVNDSGYIAGASIDEDYFYHATYWYQGDIHDLEDEIGVPEDQSGGDSVVMSINNHGLMGGFAASAAGQVAVLWDVKAETYEDVHPADYNDSAIWGVNASGSAAGWASLYDGDLGFDVAQPYAWPKGADGVALPIGDSPGGRATGINASGAVTGFFFSDEGWPRAALWTKDGSGGYALTDLHEALGDDDLILSQAFDAHENGMVVGWAWGANADGEYTYAWAWTEKDGAWMLEGDADGSGVAWKAAGTYVGGSVGVLGLTADSTPAVWVQGELEVLPEAEGWTQGECASVNKGGTAVGYWFDEEDVGLWYPWGWYAERE